MTYTQFIIQLIDLILTDNEGMSVSEIGLSEDECKRHFESGKSASELYHNVWNGDAGHYYGI